MEDDIRPGSTENAGGADARGAKASWRRHAGRLAYWAGTLVTIGAVVFIANEIWSRTSQLHEFAEPEFAAALAASVVACGLCGLLMVAGWRMSLVAASDRALSIRDTVSIYGRSNVLKYLPSNVLHFAGRYAMLLTRGFTHRAIITSTAAEHALLIAAALALAILYGAPVLLQNLAKSADDRPLIIALAIAATGTLVAGTWFLFARGLRQRSASVLTSGGLLVATTIVYIVFFLALGGVTTLLAAAADGPVDGSTYFTLTGIFAAAFIVGLITPGAPAGLGVREAIMILALQATPLSGQALVIAFGLRIATLGGDVLLAIAGFLVGRGANATAGQGGTKAV